MIARRLPREQEISNIDHCDEQHEEHDGQSYDTTFYTVNREDVVRRFRPKQFLQTSRTHAGRLRRALRRRKCFGDSLQFRESRVDGSSISEAPQNCVPFAPSRSFRELSTFPSA